MDYYDNRSHNHQHHHSRQYNSAGHGSSGGQRNNHFQKPYVSTCVSFLRSNHAQRCRGAGILPIYIHQGIPYVLLGMDKRFRRGTFSGEFLNVLGGTRDDSDPDCVTTAVREFWEESGKVMDANTRKVMRDVLRAENAAHVLWYPRGSYALFLYPAQHTNSLTELPAAFEAKKNAPNFRCEMTSLHWISLQQLANDISTNIQQNPAEIQTFVESLRQKVTIYVMLTDILKQPAMHGYIETNIPHFTIPQPLKDAAAALASQFQQHSNNNNNNNNHHHHNNNNSNNNNSNVLPVCRYYSQGFCKNGDKCQFRHVIDDDDSTMFSSGVASSSTSSSSSSSSSSNTTGLCKYFLAGHCKKGDKCNFTHAQPDSTTPSSAPSSSTFGAPSAFGGPTSAGFGQPDPNSEVQKISYQFVEWFFNQLALPNSAIHTALTIESKLSLNNEVAVGQQAILDKLALFRGIQTHLQPNIQSKGDPNGTIEIFVQGSMRDGEGRIVNFNEYFKLKKTLNLDGSSFFVILEISMTWTA